MNQSQRHSSKVRHRRVGKYINAMVFLNVALRSKNSTLNNVCRINTPVSVCLRTKNGRCRPPRINGYLSRKSNGNLLCVCVSVCLLSECFVSYQMITFYEASACTTQKQQHNHKRQHEHQHLCFNFIPWIRFDSIRFDSIRFDSIRFDSIRFDSIRFDSIRFVRSLLVTHGPPASPRRTPPSKPPFLSAPASTYLGMSLGCPAGAAPPTSSPAAVVGQPKQAQSAHTSVHARFTRRTDSSDKSHKSDTSDRSRDQIL